jgi:hypothetical protein
MTADESADRLAHAIRRSRRRQTVNLDPATTYEVVTRQMVDDALRELAAVRQRVDAMFYLVVTSIALDIVMRLVA